MGLNRTEFAKLVREYSTSAPARKQPHLELIRDGRTIAGEDCRLCMGHIVLCEAAGNAIFGGEKDPDSVDIIEAFWLMQDRNVSAASWLVNDHDRLHKTVSKYAMGLSRGDVREVGDGIAQLLHDTLDSMPKSSTGESGASRSDWYLDVVDIFASQYGWDWHHVMWELPWSRNVRLREAMGARMKGDRVLDLGNYDDEFKSMMQKAQEMAGNG